MRNWLSGVTVFLACAAAAAAADEGGEINRGATENTPSRSEYFSWINNTNEGPTEAQTLTNLAFFRWLHDAYGLKLDIYAFDAGAIDGKRFYGEVGSERFNQQFPNGFGPLAERAGEMGTRLGVWGGPDGFGETPEEEAARIEQMVRLCRDLDFALFKFDAVCGPLRFEKEDAFIRMMTECRRYAPDLILLNHRLGLEQAQAHATTFLWEGRETYIDVFSTNRMTAPHHRADALTRGVVPGLQRLTEDHGVCLSSSLDHWDDDLILQAFNRALILAPQIYGNPWLLRDHEFPKLARIFNVHRRFRDLLVEGMVLPEEDFGPAAVARGDGSTRFVTLRNLSWAPVSYEIPMDDTIGLDDEGPFWVRRFHPRERLVGPVHRGRTVTVEVPPFRSLLIMASADHLGGPGVTGVDFGVVRDQPERPVQLLLVGAPESEALIALKTDGRRFSQATLDGVQVPAVLTGAGVSIRFPGVAIGGPSHLMLASLDPAALPEDAEALYEATVFAADNNSLEIRSLERSGPTAVAQVQAARDAFFSQPVFTQRGIWDRNLFDGDPMTGFWPSRKYGIEQRIRGGSFRLDLGEVVPGGTIVLHTPDEYSLQPLLRDEANWVEVSTDLRTWRRLRYMAGLRMPIELDGPARYLRFPVAADRLTEIEGEIDGRSMDRSRWRASNLFAHPSKMEPQAAWHARAQIEVAPPGAKLAVAIEGIHGVEGAYAAIKIGDRYIGASDRAAAYPSNTWEYVNARRDRGYTYFFPITDDLLGQPLDVYVLAYDPENTSLNPVVWQTVEPVEPAGLLLVLE